MILKSLSPGDYFLHQGELYLVNKKTVQVLDCWCVDSTTAYCISTGFEFVFNHSEVFVVKPVSVNIVRGNGYTRAEFKKLKVGESFGDRMMKVADGALDLCDGKVVDWNCSPVDGTRSVAYVNRRL